jgi:hypothetical protein
LAELIVPAYRIREASGEEPEQAAADEGLRNYNSAFSSSPVTVRGFYAQVTNILLNQRFLPFMIRLRIFTMMVAAIVYVVSPFDLLSEAAVGVIGFLDDAIFIAVALWVIFRAAQGVVSGPPPRGRSALAVSQVGRTGVSFSLCPRRPFSVAARIVAPVGTAVSARP